MNESEHRVEGEKDFPFSQQEVDLLFTQEVHSGTRVRKFVEELMLEDKKPDLIQGRTEMHQGAAEINKNGWEKLVKQLPPHEQVAFRNALAKGAEDFFYTHYNAVRVRLEELGQVGKVPESGELADHTK
ncbi:MAG: hypothetical protein AAB511_02020 [Patescibacteria group bacterium]